MVYSAIYYIRPSQKKLIVLIYEGQGFGAPTPYTFNDTIQSFVLKDFFFDFSTIMKNKLYDAPFPKRKRANRKNVSFALFHY